MRISGAVAGYVAGMSNAKSNSKRCRLCTYLAVKQSVLDFFCKHNAQALYFLLHFSLPRQLVSIQKVQTGQPITIDTEARIPSQLRLQKADAPPICRGVPALAAPLGALLVAGDGEPVGVGGLVQLNVPVMDSKV